MAMTAIAVECADWDALNAKHAARIPAVCKALPAAIESRAKTLRFVMAAGLTDSFQTSLTIMSEALWQKSAVEVVASIREKRFSCSEVMESVVERIVAMLALWAGAECTTSFTELVIIGPS
jgi:hypothetical protein